MISNTEHINDSDLNKLLLCLIAGEGEKNCSINKSIDMTANYLFNSAVVVLPNPEKEQALLQKLHEVFAPQKKNRGNIFFFAIVATVLFTAFMIYRHWQKPGKDNENSPAFASTKSNDKSDSMKANLQEKNSTFIADKQKDFQKKNRPADSLKENKRGGVFFLDYMPPNPSLNKNKKNKYRVEEPDYFPVKDPVFNVKATPENYQFAKYSSFCIRPLLSYQKIILCKPWIDYPYYKGSPFKNDFPDMVEYIPDYWNKSGMEWNSDSVVQVFNKTYGFNIKFTWDSAGIGNSNEIKIQAYNGYSISYLPDAVLRYCDTNKVKHINGFTVIEELPEAKAEEMIRPFYFRKYEVTNMEYREFTDWVRAANGYENKVITIADFTQAYQYTFFYQNSEVLTGLGTNVLNVYPDTARWTIDFPYSFNEPYTICYYKHPAYDYYPVVGINYWQALAYLDWKTHFLQMQMDKENVPYDVSFELPTDLEWEMITVATNDKKDKQSLYLHDDSWLCDLMLSAKKDYSFGTNVNILRDLLLKTNLYRGNMIIDGYFHTGIAEFTSPANLFSGKTTKDDPAMLHKDFQNISYMDANVSEWMKDNYSEAWKPMFDKRIHILEQSGDPDSILVAAIEKRYDKNNAPDGRLVRGGNWYDERYSLIDGKNKAGINAKCFVEPSESHSTLGFRYVLHVKLKNEKELIEKKKKMAKFGNAMQIIDATPFHGKSIKMTAMVKMQENNPDIGSGHLWLRVDEPNHRFCFFDNMDNRPVYKTDWNIYTIEGIVDTTASKIAFGCFLAGEGKLWMDDFKLYMKKGNKWVPYTIVNGGFEEVIPEKKGDNNWFFRGKPYSIKVLSDAAYEGKKCVTIESEFEK